MFARSIQVSQLQLTLSEKVSEYGVFSGPYLSVFGLNTKSVQIWSFFWSVSFCIRTKYIECPNTEFFLVQIQKNTDQKKKLAVQEHRYLKNVIHQIDRKWAAASFDKF